MESLKRDLTLLTIIALLVAFSPACGGKNKGSDAQTDPETDVENDLDATTDPDTASDPEPDTETDVAPDTETDVAPDTETDVVPDSEMDVEADSETDVATDSAMDAEADASEDFVEEDVAEEEVVVTPSLTATHVWEIGSTTANTGDGQFDNTGDIAIDSAGNVYACDFSNDRVQKFDADGTYLAQWAEDSAMDIEIDEFDNVYVWGDWDMDKYDTSGTLIGSFRRLNYSTRTNMDNRFGVSMISDLLGTTNISSGVNNLNPYAVISSSAGHYSVVVTDKSAAYVGEFGSNGTGPAEFSRPWMIEFDSTGRMFVLDPDVNRIQVFDSTTYVEDSPVTASFSLFDGFCIDHMDRMYFRTSPTSVTVYSADGTISDTFSVACSTSGTYSIADYIQTWYDSSTSTLYAFTSTGYGVTKTRLDFVGW